MEARDDCVNEEAFAMLQCGDFDDDVAELIKEGRFDEDIKSLIASGEFDWHVLERAVALVKETHGARQY